MTTIQQLVRRQKAVLSRKMDRPAQTPGFIGDGAGVVETGTENKVYVRMHGVTTTAICDSVPHINELPVWIGYSVHDPKTLRVISSRPVEVGEDQEAEQGAHAETHRYFGDGAGGGTDVLWVDHRQIMALRLFATSNTLEVAVMPGIVYISGKPKLIGTKNANGTYTAATISLSSYMVTTADKCKIVLITLNSSGALVATAGSEVAISALNVETDTPAIPASTRWVLGAVRMYYGQSEIVEHRTNSDIIDMRWPMWHAHDGTELGFNLADIGDVTITSVTDGETLIYDTATGKWINQTLAEAGIAAASHSHTESDITNLSHDAAKIDGIAVDTTGITNGQTVIYDLANTKFIAGDAGSQLTVEEIDGTPTVSSVNKIKITNGTLTDNGDGTITIDFGSAATDGAAIHDNTAGEIHAITEKTSLADDDEFILEDSADSYNKKRVKKSNLISGSGGDSTYTDIYASRPAASNNGNIFLPSDGFTLQRDTGAAWIPWGPLYKFTEPPAVADFTWENQGTASATKTKGGIYITDTTDSNVNRILYKSAPSAPFTVTMGFLINSLGITNESGGMLLRQSSDGKLVTFGDLVSTGQKISITKWGNYSTWVGAYKESAVNLAVCYASPLFLRYYDDGTTNRVFSISRDGQNFLTFLSQSRTDYLTIDQIGFFIGLNGAGSSVGMTLLHWSVT